ncbi:hypothetical protein HDU97_006514 [Phlyctochytrium planicorne]|nr:hypothetical protein HDU97_006514 [Phlyctochytrium planicorne]
MPGNFTINAQADPAPAPVPVDAVLDAVEKAVDKVIAPAPGTKSEPAPAATTTATPPPPPPAPTEKVAKGIPIVNEPAPEAPKPPAPAPAPTPSPAPAPPSNPPPEVVKVGKPLFVLPEQQQQQQAAPEPVEQQQQQQQQDAPSSNAPSAKVAANNAAPMQEQVVPSGKAAPVFAAPAASPAANPNVNAVPAVSGSTTSGSDSGSPASTGGYAFTVIGAVAGILLIAALVTFGLVHRSRQQKRRASAVSLPVGAGPSGYAGRRRGSLAALERGAAGMPSASGKNASGAISVSTSAYTQKDKSMVAAATAAAASVGKKKPGPIRTARNHWGDVEGRRGEQTQSSILDGIRKNYLSWMEGPAPTTPDDMRWSRLTFNDNNNGTLNKVVVVDDKKELASPGVGPAHVRFSLTTPFGGVAPISPSKPSSFSFADKKNPRLAQLSTANQNGFLTPKDAVASPLSAVMEDDPSSPYTPTVTASSLAFKKFTKAPRLTLLSEADTTRDSLDVVDSMFNFDGEKKSVMQREEDDTEEEDGDIGKKFEVMAAKHMSAMQDKFFGGVERKTDSWGAESFITMDSLDEQ